MRKEHLSLSCASLNFVLAATSSVTLLSLPNLFPWLASLRAPMKWQSEAARSEVCGGWERAVWILWLFPLYSNLSVVTQCHVEVGLQPSFCGSDSLEMLLQGFKSLNVQIWVNRLTTWHNVYQNNPLLHHKDKWPWLSLLNGLP